MHEYHDFVLANSGALSRAIIIDGCILYVKEGHNSHQDKAGECFRTNSEIALSAPPLASINKL